MASDRNTGPAGDKPWSPRTSTGCPVEPGAQAWIETSMRWFVDTFGKDAALGEMALPTADFYPADYAGSVEQIARLIVKVSDWMLCGPLEVDLVLFEPEDKDKRAVGHFQVRDGRVEIGLDRTEVSDPAFLTAIIAHEIGHVRLLYEGRITKAGKNHERLTDLLTVYLRFGVFTANAALRFTETTRGWSAEPLGDLSERDLHGAGNGGYSRLGYLSEQEFGYALACLCRLRGEAEPAWARHLDPGPRVHLKQGIAYLARYGGADDQFPTVRAASGSAWVLTTANKPVRIRVVPQETRLRIPSVGEEQGRIGEQGTSSAQAILGWIVAGPRSM